MLRNLVVALLTGHGVGHALFRANVWGYWRTGGSASWVFGGLPADVRQGLAVGWLPPLLGFIPGARGVEVGAVWASGVPPVAGWSRPLVAWSRQTLLACATLSAVRVGRWWGALVPGSAVFALLFDLLVIAVLLWRPDVVAGPSAWGHHRPLASGRGQTGR